MKIDRSPQGFADRNGISTAKAYIEIRAGRLKAKKMGKRTIILERDELAWQDNLDDVVIDEDGHMVMNFNSNGMLDKAREKRSA